MYTDGTRRTSQFSCYESTVVNFVGGALPKLASLEACYSPNVNGLHQ